MVPLPYMSCYFQRSPLDPYLIDCQLQAYFVNVKPDICTVAYREIYEEIVSAGIDIVQSHSHTMPFAAYVAESGR